MIPFQDDFPFTQPRLAAAPPFADYVEDVVLAADALQRVAIPAGARYVLMSFDGDVRVRTGTAAASFLLPAATTADGAGSELNPAARRLPTAPPGGTSPTHLLLRSAAACRGSVSFYA